MSAPELEQGTKDFYLRSMQLMDDAKVPYLVGGAYSLAHYANIVRHTKDFDVFVRRRDVDRALDVFNRNGYRTDRTFPHWLAKAYRPNSDDFVDVIYSSGNGLCNVDDQWFEHAVDGTVIGRRAKLVPPEEIIWTKSFIMERERFDGADVAHLIVSRGREINWLRLLDRFKGHEQVLLGHLIFFTYIYPRDRENVPAGVLDTLFNKVRPQEAAKEKICQGTFISREQYLMDLRERGYQDARLKPHGPMNAEDVAHWTAAIGTIK